MDERVAALQRCEDEVLIIASCAERIREHVEACGGARPKLGSFDGVFEQASAAASRRAAREGARRSGAGSDAEGSAAARAPAPPVDAVEDFQKRLSESFANTHVNLG